MADEFMGDMTPTKKAWWGLKILAFAFITYIAWAEGALPGFDGHAGTRNVTALEQRMVNIELGLIEAKIDAFQRQWCEMRRDGNIKARIYAYNLRTEYEVQRSQITATKYVPAGCDDLGIKVPHGQ